MRILLIHDWNPGSGGSEAYVGWLADRLQARGHEIHLLTGDAGAAGEGRPGSVARAGRSTAERSWRQVFNTNAWQVARSIARTFSPDVVHLHHHAYQLSASVVLALEHLPIVTTLHDYKNICPLGTKALPDGSICTRRAGFPCLEQCLSTPHWLRDQMRYRFLDVALRRARRVLVYSEHLRSLFQQHGIPAECSPIPVSQPTEAFHRTPAPEPLFVCAARLEPEKGVESLLVAFARLHPEIPQARLRIVGDGTQRARLQQRTHQLGLQHHVEFTGWQPPDRINQWLADAWCIVAPSLMAEPFGLVAPESILRGIPVIASRAGGFADTVSPGSTGLLFPNGDSEALLQCLRDIATRRSFPTLSCHPAAVGILRRRLDPLGHLQHIEEIYRSVSAPPPGRGPSA